MIKVFIEYKDGPSMTRICSSWDVARKAVRAAIDRGEAISACLREVGERRNVVRYGFFFCKRCGIEFRAPVDEKRCPECGARKVTKFLEDKG